MEVNERVHEFHEGHEDNEGLVPPQFPNPFYETFKDVFLKYPVIYLKSVKR